MLINDKFFVDVRDNLKALDLEPIIAEAIEDTKNDVIQLQHEQLLDGKRSDGEDITPSYFEDPYFKTPEAAKAYSDWKDRITPNPRRKRGTPNLYINGWLHENINISVSGKEVEFGSDVYFENKIDEKYGAKLWGLTKESQERYRSGEVMDLIYNAINSKTGLNLKSI